jgi:hypothetical protein
MATDKKSSQTELSEENARLMFKKLKDSNWTDATIDHEYDALKDALKESGSNVSKEEYRAIAKTLKKLDFNQFKDYIINSELPAVKLAPQEMEILKAGQKISTGGWIAVIACAAVDGMVITAAVT